MLRLVIWAAIAEFLLLRVFLRLGQVLPGEGSLLPLYRLVETLGLAALNLATLAAAGLILASAAASLSAALVKDVRIVRPAAGRVAALALVGATLVNLGLGPLLVVAPAPVVVVLQAASTMAAMVAVAVHAYPLARGRATVALVVLAELFALYHVLTQGAAGLGLGLPGGGMPLFLAEALAVASALALPWSFGVRPARTHVALGLGLAGLFFAAHTARAWTVATMAMWTVSFSLFLPGPLYAAGLGTAAAGLLALRREPTAGNMAAGLLLVALAGLKLDFTYFALLALAGLLATCRAVHHSAECRVLSPE